jgi:hypothetical protein
MKQNKKRLDKLERKAGSGGPYTLTIKYEHDWQVPPRQPVVMEAPDLNEDTVIVVEYIDDWRQ